MLATDLANQSDTGAATMKFTSRIWVVLSVCLAVLIWAAPARADLAEYVKKADDSFAWKLKEKNDNNGNRIYGLELISQKWHDIIWDHRLYVYLHKDAKPGKTMVLMNTGALKPLESHFVGIEMSRQCQTPVAILYDIPKQPLFGDKKEDALIAETFVRFLETRDDSWPLLFPMVKSVVKAMDALQAFTKEEWKEPVQDFVVTGASKRGWTTWLTAATGDPRVKAIAPMVIDVLDMVNQMKHQNADFGRPSDQVHDYVERGLVPLPNTEDAQRLWRMVDPYSYRDKLTLPKLMILGNNDPYWATDALNLYWDGLRGPRYVTYVPNAGHDLQQDKNPDRARAIGALAGFTRHIAADKPMPKLDWKHDDAGGKLRLVVDASPAPVSARLWVATAPTRDFRESRWEEHKARTREARVVGEVDPPKEGCLAFYGDLEYEIGGLKYHLCTQIRIAGEPVKK
jgi:PhoPQ-activated pathogenicity-related protein